MKLTKFSTLVLLQLITTSSFAFEKKTSPKLTFYTESYPPANYIENGKMKGITVDTLKAIWKELGMSEQEIKIVPWVRGYRFALDKPNSVLFTMSRTQPREKLFKWVGPIFNSTHVLIGKKAKKFDFANLGQLFYHKIAAVRGDISSISLNQVGFPDYNFTRVTELMLAFKMMESDRVDMIVTTIHGFDHLSKQLEIDYDQYEVVWQINKFGNYIAFNNKTSNEIISKYQSALERIANQHVLIKKKYGLHQAEY